MSQYPNIMAAATTATKASFALAAALAQDIPETTARPDVGRHIHAVIFDMRQAGHASYTPETLHAYRLMGLHYAAAGFDPSKSFRAHMETFKSDRAAGNALRNEAARAAAGALRLAELDHAEKADRLAIEQRAAAAPRLTDPPGPSKAIVGRNSVSEYEAREHIESLTRHAERQAERAPIMAAAAARDAAIILPRIIGADYAGPIDAARDERKAQHANGQTIGRVTIEHDPAATAASRLLNTVRQAVKAYEAATGLSNGPEMVAALYAPAL